MPPKKTLPSDSSSFTPVTSSSRGHLFPLKNGVSEGTIFSLSRSSQCLIYQLIKSAGLGGADAQDKTHQAQPLTGGAGEALARLMGLSWTFLPIPTSLSLSWSLLDSSPCHETSGFVFIPFSGNASFSSSLVSIDAVSANPRKCVSRFASVRFSEVISV